MAIDPRVIENPRAFLAEVFEVAVKAGNPLQGIKANLPRRPKGRVIVVGAGKASAQMAMALEALWEGPLEGAVVSRHGTTAELKQIKLMTAAHPVPDIAGLRASHHLLDLVQNLTKDDLVIALISGGGSALLPAPQEGLALQDEIDLNTALLKSGAPISAMNAIRKHISLIKGGRLAAAAYPAKVVSFVVSDIPGDVLSLVSSGPTIADDVSLGDAWNFIAKHDIALSSKLIAHLRSALPAPSPDNTVFAGHEVHLVASAKQSLKAAAAYALSRGLPAHILSDAIEGESHEVAKMHAAMAVFARSEGRPFQPPCLMLSGGETTVTIGHGGAGKGGRNGEFALSFALAIAGREGIHCLAADSDGIDGSENNAGAFADGKTVDRILATKLDPSAFLTAHDSWTALNEAGDLFITGPTGTNVNDFRAILLLP
ncbi:MAG: glycerate kinase [Aestuariivirga sp.]